MSKEINTKLPVRFYDDRNKDKSVVLLEKILFEDEETCLCSVSVDGDSEGIDEEFKKVLFQKSDGEVLTDNFQFWIAENYSPNINTVDVDMNLIPDWQREKAWAHLQAWFAANTPGENMKYKEAAERQIMFIRDEFYGFFPEKMIKKIEVISTHTSKSIKLPVYHVVLMDGFELIMRGNFHDWKISINSPMPIELPEKLLSNSTLSGEKIHSCYCEGFSEDWIWDSYMTNKQKFTIEIGSSLYDLYTFLFIFSTEVDKHSKAIEAL